LHSQGIEFVEPSDLSGAIRGRHNIYTHLETMIKELKKCYYNDNFKRSYKKVRSFKSCNTKLAKKNVKVRIAAPVNKETKDSIKI